MNWFISIVSISGSAYLANIAYKIFKAPSSINPMGNGGAKSSLFTAVKINFLNPAPYIFWLTIGSGYILMGTHIEGAAFVFCAIISLCITKFIVAIVIKKLGERFDPKVYATILRSLSLPLLFFSVQLLYFGITAWK